MIRRFINNILTIGIDSAAELSGESRYIQRTNFINLTILSLVIIYGILFYPLGARFHSVLMIGVFELFLLVFVFNYKKWYTVSRLWQILLIAFCVFYYGNSFGKEAGVQYLVFVFITLPFITFGSKRYYVLAFGIVLFMLVFYAIEYQFWSIAPVLDERGQRIMNATLTTLILLWVVANYVYYERTNREVENELRANNAKLESKNKELEQFTYIASHDLKEPLLTMSNYAGLLDKKYKAGLDEDGGRYIDYIVRGSARMQQLIAGLMEYGRLGQQGKPVEIIPRVLIESVLHDMSAAIEESQARVIIDELPVIKGYEMELRLLFQNLLSNAMKFRKPNVPVLIHIAAKRADGFWQFELSDNGIGMPGEQLDKIFIIFQRLHSRKKYDGTGIGLAHCRKIVEVHGGTIRAESILNVGSKFVFTIPV